MRANCRGSKLRLVLVLPVLLYVPCLRLLGLNVQQRRPQPLFTSSTSTSTSTSTHVNNVRSLSPEPAAEEEVEVDGSGSGSGCNDDWSDSVWSGGKARSISIESSSDNPPQAPLTIAKVQRIEMCVAYCHADLRWLRDAIAIELASQQVEINLTIMSKCNNEADIVDFGGLGNVKVEVIQLPNKGGCDLAHAHFITRYLSREAPLQSSAPASSTSSTVLVFLEDSPPDRNDGRIRSVNELVRLALQRDDFICGLELDCWMSAYHDVKTLGHFMCNSYRRTGGGPKVGGTQFNPASYRDLSDFVDRELNWTFPNDEAVQVCYGGQFATTESRLFNGNRAAMEILFRRLEQILMESPAIMNVVEHFVERLYAGILAKPLTPSQVQEILVLNEFVFKQQGGHMGAFVSENIQGCCKNNGVPDWGGLYWDALNDKAQKAAKLLGFNKEIWDSDSELPIYSTPFSELAMDKVEAVEYLGMGSYFT